MNDIDELRQSIIEDICLAASKMSGVSRRSFQGRMCLKYCGGSARKAETIFGWGRNNVSLGIKEEQSGIVCLGRQANYSGAKKWEEKQSLAAIALMEIAEAHCQQEPSFKTSIAYSRLTASQAICELQKKEFKEEEIPSKSTMATILNRMGYRLRKVIKAKPQKKNTGN